MSCSSIFIGATLAPIADAKQFFAPVKIPGNMSVQATKEKHVGKVEGQRYDHSDHPPLGFAGSIVGNEDKYENHYHRPMMSALASVTILDGIGNPVYHQEEAPPVARGKVALPLLRYLLETYPDQFSDTLRYGDVTPTVSIFGFDLKAILRIAAFEVLYKNGVGKAPLVALPVRLWSSPAGVYDVLDVLLPASDQKDLDLYSLLRYFDVSATPQEMATSSQVQARVACTLVERAQLARPEGGAA